MTITGAGWELQVHRLEVQESGTKIRTYGSYQAYLDGKPIAGLSGNVCESPGPSENEFPATKEDPRRIRLGRYPLWTYFGGRYWTMGYEPSVDPPGVAPMPGLLLFPTGKRTKILIHPGHPGDPNSLYLSSIGCLNLTKPLQANENMDFVESRSRVIALIDSLTKFSPSAFEQGVGKKIPNAAVDIEGDLDDIA